MPESYIPGPVMETGQLTPNQVVIAPTATTEIFDVSAEQLQLPTEAKDAASTMVASELRIDTSETGVNMLLTPETLQTPAGLSVEIKNHEEAQAVADQLNSVRSFLSGNTEAGAQITPDKVASNPQEAIKMLPDLATLHIGDTEYVLAETAMLNSGINPEQVAIELALLKSEIQQKAADILSQSVRGTDFFKHSILNGGDGLRSVLTGGSLKTKAKMMSEGVFNTATNNGVVDFDTAGSETVEGAIKNSEGGLHSLLLHTRLVDGINNTSGLEVYFPATAIAEQLPIMTLGMDDKGASRTRITGRDEAHGGGPRSTFTEVIINVDQHFLSNLPPPAERVLSDDVSFMHDAKDAKTAAEYELSLESGVVLLDNRGAGVAMQALREATDRRGIFTDAQVKKYFEDEAALYKFTKDVIATYDDVENGLSFDEMPFNTPEAKEVFKKLVDEMKIAKELLDLTKKDTGEPVGEDVSKTSAARTAIVRTIMQDLGYDSEWTHRGVYLLDPELNNNETNYKQIVTESLNSNVTNGTLVIESRKQQLAFDQTDISRAAVTAYRARKTS